jgi:hypothetical protein
MRQQNVTHDMYISAILGYISIRLLQPYGCSIIFVDQLSILSVIASSEHPVLLTTAGLTIGITETQLVYNAY